jgi:hypothetical protein
MIVLESAGLPPRSDGVWAAMVALAEAARASSLEYAPSVLAAALEETVVLLEVGGLNSWLARYFTGKDPDAAGELGREVEGGVRSEGHREELLAHCDKLIHEARTALTDSTSVDFLKSLPVSIAIALLGVAVNPAFGLAAIHSATVTAGRTGARANGSVKRYLSALVAVRGKIASAKLAT